MSTSPTTSNTYDKIIIGGGSAGCVLAHRLSEDSSTRVLVLEAGRPDYRLDFRLHMPAALTYPLANRTYNWWYESGPGTQFGWSSCISTSGKGSRWFQFY